MTIDCKTSNITRRGFLSVAGVAGLGAVLGLVGCSAPAPSSEAPQPEAEPTPKPQETAPEAAPEPAPAAPEPAATETPAGGGKTLVAYYSAQGHTRVVAEAIAEALDADIFEITPVQPYSEDDLNWRADGSRVNVEHDDPSQRDIQLTQVTPDNFADYDTVFLGYPIWWGIAAWPVDNFVAGNDFSGKTIVPFCTSTSSGLGESASELAALAGTGNWLDGQRFASNATPDVVAEWALELSL